jgi:hypothetical protein
MLRGPRGERRSEDPTRAAVMAAWIETGEITESLDSTPPAASCYESKLKNPAVVALGRLGGQQGGKARAERLRKVERRVVARKAAAVRQKK